MVLYNGLDAAIEGEGTLLVVQANSGEPAIGRPVLDPGLEEFVLSVGLQDGVVYQPAAEAHPANLFLQLGRADALDEHGRVLGPHWPEVAMLCYYSRKLYALALAENYLPVRSIVNELVVDAPVERSALAVN
jgi:hypothetical protein